MTKKIEFPEEVWLNILRFNTNPIHLCVQCRRVSRCLRRCAKTAYEENFLQDLGISLIFPWPSHADTQQLRLEQPRCNLIFNRLETDNNGDLTNKAFFSSSTPGLGLVSTYYLGLPTLTPYNIRMSPRYLDRVFIQLKLTEKRPTKRCEITSDIQAYRDILISLDGTMTFDWPTRISEWYNTILQQEQDTERARAFARDIVRKKPRTRPQPRIYPSELLREGRWPKWKQTGPPRRSARISKRTAKAS